MSEALRTARYSDLLALGDEVKGEIIAGAVEIQASPRTVHGGASTRIARFVTRSRRRSLGERISQTQSGRSSTGFSSGNSAHRSRRHPARSGRRV